jgi:hypothetical protein
VPSHDPKTRNRSGPQVDYRGNASGSLEYLDALDIESHNLTSSDKPLAEPDSEAGTFLSAPKREHPQPSGLEYDDTFPNWACHVQLENVSSCG